MERLTKNVDGCNQIIDCGNDLCKETCEEWSCEFCPISKAIDKLAEYEDAEEQGLLFRLPFKIGQKVYYIYKSCIDESLMIGSMVYSYSCLDFPRNYFETREEAEQALKRMESE